jgi:hypothetical protein
MVWVAEPVVAKTEEAAADRSSHAKVAQAHASIRRRAESAKAYRDWLVLRAREMLIRRYRTATAAACQQKWMRVQARA